METIKHKTFKPENITFSKAKNITRGDNFFKRIYVTYKYPNGETDKLHIQTPKLLSYGVQSDKNSNFDSTSVESYSLPLVLYDSNIGTTENESRPIELLETILSLIKAHLNDPAVKKDMGHNYSDVVIDTMKVFYRNSFKGITLDDVPPTFYPKLYTKF